LTSRLAAIVIPALVLVACAVHPDKHTLASLHRMPADTSEVKVEDGLDKAMQSYRRFLDETPEGAMTPEAMRRLADLKLEKEYGILGDGKIVEVEAKGDPKIVDPKATPGAGAPVHTDARAAGEARRNAIQPGCSGGTERALEQRAMAQQPGVPEESAVALDVPEGVGVEKAGPRGDQTVRRAAREVSALRQSRQCYRPARMTSSTHGRSHESRGAVDCSQSRLPLHRRSPVPTRRALLRPQEIP
jgi:hypothetical protein